MALCTRVCMWTVSLASLRASEGYAWLGQASIGPVSPGPPHVTMCLDLPVCQSSSPSPLRLLLTVPLRDGHYYCLHFTIKETEAQRGDMSWPKVI